MGWDIRRDVCEREAFYVLFSSFPRALVFSAIEMFKPGLQKIEFRAG